MTSLQTIAASASPEVPTNENFESLSGLAFGAKRHPATSGLVWGYYGGRYKGNTVANGTVTLTNGATNYIVVKKSDGVISVSTATTNWNDGTNYQRLYQVMTSGGAVTAELDCRLDTNGLFA